MKERRSNSSNSPLHDRLHTAHSPQRPFWDLRGWSASGQMVVSVIIGAGVGTLVSTNAANGRADLAFWLGFPGGLFLRALKALVIPLIFCSIVCSTVEMSTLGLAGTVGSSTFLCYMATTALAVLTGIVSCTAFKSLYSGHDEAIELLETNVAFVCGGGGFATGDDGSDGSGITHVMTAVGDDRHGSSSSRSVQCLPLSTEDEPFFGSDDADEIIDRLSRNATFGFLDVNGVVQRTTSSIVAEQESIPETIAGALESIVTDNFTAATAEPDILAIICFAIFFGSAVAKIDALLLGRKNLVLVLLSQLNEVVTAMLALVLSLTPLAVASLIAGAIATVDDYSKLLGDVGTLMASYFTTFAVQVFVNYPVLIFVLTRGRVNPWRWYEQCLEAYIVAFSLASSAGSLPVTIPAVQKGDQMRVPESLAKFVLSMGATVNMDASACYYPCVQYFMACVSGNASALTAPVVVKMVLMATFGAPAGLPASGLVINMSIWGACFPHLPLPAEFAYVQAVDWMLDRFRTVSNVCGDTSVCVIIAARNESEAADNGQEVEFTEAERRSVFLEGDSKAVAAVRERATLLRETIAASRASSSSYAMSFVRASPFATAKASSASAASSVELTGTGMARAGRQISYK